MKAYWLIGLLFMVLASASCKPQVAKGLQIECPDGTLVYNMSDCVMEEENIEAVQYPTQQNITLPEVLKNETPPKNISTLRRTFVNETKGELYLDPNGWSVLEIVNGMGTYNEKFRAIFPQDVVYGRDKREYRLGGSYKLQPDPFWIARSHYQSGTKEFKVNSFRIYLVQSPYEFYDMIMEKHNDTKFQILYPEEWTEWASISCSKLNTCREIEAIKCVKEEHELYMWKHGAKGEGYTSDAKYNMQAVDDNKETLDTFEKFYCTPI